MDKSSSARSAIQDTIFPTTWSPLQRGDGGNHGFSGGISPSRALIASSSHWSRYSARHTVSFPPTYFRSALVCMCVSHRDPALARETREIPGGGHRRASNTAESQWRDDWEEIRARFRKATMHHLRTSARRDACILERSAVWCSTCALSSPAITALSLRLYSVQVCAPINVATFLIYGWAERRNLAAATFRRCIYLLFAAKPVNWDSRM